MSDLSWPIAMVLRMLMFHCVLRFSADPWDLHGESSSWMLYNGQSDTTIGWELGVPPFLETPINKPYKYIIYIYKYVMTQVTIAYILALWVLLVKPDDLENPKIPLGYPLRSSAVDNVHPKWWDFTASHGADYQMVSQLLSHYDHNIIHYYPIIIPSWSQLWFIFE